jgi:hypothetical protein
MNINGEKQEMTQIALMLISKVKVKKLCLLNFVECYINLDYSVITKHWILNMNGAEHVK